MILFLPPAPHTGAFYDSIRDELSEMQTTAVTYPGYGNVAPVKTSSIEAYAKSILPQRAGTQIIGFHTGCLVALEMAHIQPDLGHLVLIDIPYFDEATKNKHRENLDPDNKAHAAFFAAFDYDLERALSNCTQRVTVVATQSSLYEATLAASAKLAKVDLIKRHDITKPVFENPLMAKLVKAVLVDNSQMPVC